MTKATRCAGVGVDLMKPSRGRGGVAEVFASFFFFFLPTGASFKKGVLSKKMRDLSRLNYSGSWYWGNYQFV